MKVFHFHGTYRALGVRPKDFSLRAETVDGWRTPVLTSDWERHCDVEGIVTPALSSAGNAASALEPKGPVQVVVATFSLPPGSYATSVLREFCIRTTENGQGNDLETEDEYSSCADTMSHDGCQERRNGRRHHRPASRCIVTRSMRICSLCRSLSPLSLLLLTYVM
uniref:Uncharacterized protein L8382.03 n=1 Tax=Leishmania major TaxID=5664 RepID=Q9N874_LEIMA|nr:hypothetical protein L8382.03 [Leishmania major]